MRASAGRWGGALGCGSLRGRAGGLVASGAIGPGRAQRRTAGAEEEVGEAPHAVADAEDGKALNSGTQSRNGAVKRELGLVLKITGADPDNHTREMDGRGGGSGCVGAGGCAGSVKAKHSRAAGAWQGNRKPEGGCPAAGGGALKHSLGRERAQVGARRDAKVVEGRCEGRRDDDNATRRQRFEEQAVLGGGKRRGGNDTQ